MTINKDTLQGFKVVHTWCGLLAGLFLFIAFFAGSITVFREDIAQWQFAEQTLSIHESLDLIPALIEKSIEADPRATNGLMVTLPGDHSATPQAQWRTDGEEALYARFSETGEFQLFEPSHFQLSRFVDELHRNAGIPGITGEWLMGVAALIYGIALVSGVILFLPTLAKNIFALRTGQQLRRFWLDIHNSLGVFSLPFHILFALTGAVMALHDPMLDAMNKLLYPENGQQLLMQTIFPYMPSASEPIPAEMLSPREILSNINHAYPEFKPAALIYTQPNTLEGIVSVFGHIPQHLAHQTMIVASTQSGEILATHLPGDRPHGIVALAGFRALHYGDFGGNGVAWLYFILGMAGSILFYSGNLLWLETRRRKNQTLQKKAHMLLAKLTVSTCLGCCLGITFAFIASRTGLVHSDSGIGLLSLYWMTMLLCVAWTAIRPILLAAKEILIITSIAAMAIPSITLITTDQTLTGVDYTSALFSGFFGLIAYKTHRRILYGQPNSVWGQKQCSQA